MNIFYLSRNTELCARWHVDKHVAQMCREYPHLLSIAHRMFDGRPGLDPWGRMGWRLDDPVMDDHLYHVANFARNVCTEWTNASRANYRWLFALFEALAAEYRYRYGADHDNWTRLGELLREPPTNQPEGDWTHPYPAMHPRFEVTGSCLQSYRRCYRYGKNPFAIWTGRTPPEWYMIEGMTLTELRPGKTGQRRVQAVHPNIETEITPRGKRRGIVVPTSSATS